MEKEWEKLELLEWEYLMAQKLRKEKEEINKAKNRYIYQEKKIKKMMEKSNEN